MSHDSSHGPTMSRDEGVVGAGAQERPAYQPPALLVLGDVGQHTLGAGSSTSDGPLPGGAHP